VVGIEGPELGSLLRALAGILHLGQIAFEGDEERCAVGHDDDDDDE
jgi:myosin heavy subunit